MIVVCVTSVIQVPIHHLSCETQSGREAVQLEGLQLAEDLEFRLPPQSFHLEFSRESICFH